MISDKALQVEEQPSTSTGQMDSEQDDEGDMEIDDDLTPLEDHIAGRSRLQQMAEDTRRIDEMPEPAMRPPGESKPREYFVKYIFGEIDVAI